mmetsp:Transcript_5215/g.14589  ORF Transcript_5215/g.14589 Transcript_5215/m.14589 type:complete len:243 (+) Transcript_5215:254-982(+)
MESSLALQELCQPRRPFPKPARVITRGASSLCMWFPMLSCPSGLRQKLMTTRRRVWTWRRKGTGMMSLRCWMGLGLMMMMRRRRRRTLKWATIARNTRLTQGWSRYWHGQASRGSLKSSRSLLGQTLRMRYSSTRHSLQSMHLTQICLLHASSRTCQAFCCGERRKINSACPPSVILGIATFHASPARLLRSGMGHVHTLGSSPTTGPCLSGRFKTTGFASMMQRMTSSSGSMSLLATCDGP